MTRSRAYLRDSESPAGFDRYNAFLKANPEWSSDDNPGRHLRRILVGKFLIRPDRNFFEELLYIGAHDAVRLELRRHHIAVKQRHREQVRQAVIRLFLGPDDLVYAVEAAASKIVGDPNHVGLDRNDLAGVEFVPSDEFDHAIGETGTDTRVTRALVRRRFGIAGIITINLLSPHLHESAGS
jgi:hypothetical protein